MHKRQFLIGSSVVFVIAFVFGCRDFESPTEPNDHPSAPCDQRRWPAPDEFVPVETYPEMVTFVQPEYPSLAYQAGLEGVVWVKVLIDRCGKVRNAMVAHTSGTASLDESAVRQRMQTNSDPGF